MAHVITIQPKPIQSVSGKFTVHQIPAATDNVVWLIEYAPGRCAVVDGPSATEVLTYTKKHQLQITTILNTHTHGDHIGINRALAKLGIAQSLRIIGAKKRENDVPFITETVCDGDTVQLGELTGSAWLTEGHIDGHICYLFEDFLFCGDTLFAGGCGYLFDGPPVKMHQSLQRLATLPDHTKVCCAHEYTQDNLRFAYSIEPNNQALITRMQRIWRLRNAGESSLPSSIKDEKETNPFIRVTSLEITNSLRQSYPDVDNAPASEVFAYTRKHKDSKQYRTLPEPAFLQ